MPHASRFESVISFSYQVMGHALFPATSQESSKIDLTLEMQAAAV